MHACRSTLEDPTIEAVGPVSDARHPAAGGARCRPIGSYGRSKAEAEKLVREIAGRASMSWAIARIGNVYGPGHANFIIDIARAIQDHSREREFLPVFAGRLIQPAYLEDVVEGLCLAARSDNVGTFTLAGEGARIGDIFGACAAYLQRRLSPRPSRWHERLFLTLRARYHRHRQAADLITYFMATPWLRPHRVCDLSASRQQWGYQARTGLEQGVAMTLAWAREKKLLMEVM